MAGPFDDLIGELSPGQQGWLPLDEAGNPSGPATISPPPGPDAKACRVMATVPSDPVDPEDHLLVSSTGAPLEPPLNSNVDKRVGDTSAPAPPPILLTGISPTTAVVGSAALTLTATGSGFTAASIMQFGGSDLVTSFVDETSVTAQVDPTSAVAGTVPVLVKDAFSTSSPQNFEFTAVAGRSGESRSRQDEDRRTRRTRR